MRKKRSPQQSDWVSWTLLFSLLFVSLAVLTLEPLPGTSPEPPSQSVFGTGVVWLGTGLFLCLGQALYLLLFAWFVLVLELLQKKPKQPTVLHFMGWIVLVPLCALAADRWLPTSATTLFLAAGGTLGAWLHLAISKALLEIPFFIALGVWAVVGLTLAIPLTMQALARSVVATVKIILLGTARIIGTLSRGIGKLFTRKPNDAIPLAIELPEPAAETAVDNIPIVRNADPVPTVAEAPVEPVKVPDPEPTILPIQRNLGEKPEETENFADYELPSLSMLDDPAPFPWEDHDQKLRDTAVLLEKTFKDFDLNVRVVGINTGPVITQYEVALETGLRVNKITPMSDDLALNLKVPSVRILAPIPGKNTVGIEIPNEHRATVHMKEVMLAYGKKIQKAKLPLFLGKDTEGRPLVHDLAEMPHLLIAGRTGTGKSVCLNSIILSLLMARRPDEVKMIMIDPKMLELSEYAKVPHLMHPVVKDMKKAEAILAWAVDKMEERYDLLSRVRVRGIAGYNELGLEEILRRAQPDEEETKRIQAKMPYIIIFVDEMGDLMMTMKREVEGHIIRLAQKSRAAGIHLVVATQKPTVDVITGLIKSNLPARICFQVSSRMDSRVVLDEMGAEKLLGRGDMLFLQPGSGSIMRAQGTYASDAEISRIVGHLECDKPCYAAELVQLKTSADASGMDKLKARDEMYEQAIEIVVREGRGSVSLLQRALGIGYGRAARLIDFMAEDGIVGAYNGSNAREVLYSVDDWLQMKAGAEPAHA